MVRHFPFVTSIAAALLWVVGFSALGKRVGIPSPTRCEQHFGVFRPLTLNQYACLYGALGWGMALFVAWLVEDYFRGKLSNNVIGFAGRIAFEIVIWMAAGCFFGWMMWGGYRRKA